MENQEEQNKMTRTRNARMKPYYMEKENIAKESEKEMEKKK
jgi:hypothetical protein